MQGVAGISGIGEAGSDEMSTILNERRRTGRCIDFVDGEDDGDDEWGGFGAAWY